MIICPNCHHNNIHGAVFCGECGARLITTNSTTQSLGGAEPPVPTNIPMPSTSAVEGGISLHLMESGQILSLAGRSEFTIGRATEGQPILPDVDLTTYDAFSQGVSRLHAALRILNQKLVVIDLGSSNGTRVNGQKILPHIDYPLNHGDILALGKLKIQILFRK
jgi:pSer/pThr/pTyr-binding forkhead associated (FHA) protein